MEKLDISVIILTYNEEIHIRRCLSNALSFAKNIFVIDSFSTDRTVEIAKEMGAVVLQKKWENNYAKQFNWGLDNAPIKTEWILRLDADEYLEDSLVKKLYNEIPTMENSVSAISIRLKHIFEGIFLKGGTGCIYLTRIFRKGKAASEVRLMDEHIQVLEGKTVQWEEAFYDDNLNNIHYWSQKHLGYAIREAADLLNVEYSLSSANDNILEGQARKKRQLKLQYAKNPLFLRSFIYFVYRYIIRGGFREGKEGFIWCFLQGWWYRMLVDTHIFEIKRKCGNDKQKIILYLKKEYGVEL